MCVWMSVWVLVNQKKNPTYPRVALSPGHLSPSFSFLLPTPTIPHPLTPGCIGSSMCVFVRICLLFLLFDVVHKTSTGRRAGMNERVEQYGTKQFSQRTFCIVHGSSLFSPHPLLLPLSFEHFSLNSYYYTRTTWTPCYCRAKEENKRNWQ